jgi:hypothetical protein
MQKSESDIDEQRFFSYARTLVDRYFSEKTFLEIYYKYTDSIDKHTVYSKVQSCLKNFLEAPATVGFTCQLSGTGKLDDRAGGIW